MGRIATKLTKRLTTQLRKTYPDTFSTDYEENKKLVEAHLEGPSKKIRNTVAGYMTRLSKRAE